MDLNWANLATDITAIGTLGTAAFGLVDATKLFRGGTSSSGFIFLQRVIEGLTPEPVAPKPQPVEPGGEKLPTQPPDTGAPPVSATSREAILQVARANWLNGQGLADQRSAIKALLKLRLNEFNADRYAQLTGVDTATLLSVAKKLSNGETMTQAELDTYGRFDLLLTTTLDQAFQRADQRYRNTSKLVAGVIAIILAEIGAFSLAGNASSPIAEPHSWKLAVQAFVTGLLATPLAPIAKDISSAIGTATKTMQTLRK